MTTTTSGGKPPVPKPYSMWFHPLKTWLDILVSLLLILLMPLDHLAQLPAYEDNDKTTAKNKKLRDTLINSFPSSSKPAITQWSKGLGQDIVEVTISIPRKFATMFKEWNLSISDEKQILDKMPKEDILVTLRMPLSVCSEQDAALASKGTNEFGCRTLETINLAKLDKDTPFCVHFHGGGLTIGGRNESAPLDIVQHASVTTGKPIVLASVGYSLAPTHVFPAAIMDGLTVLSYFMEQMPDRPFHMTGISAGGNVATVTSMELYRRSPAKLASLGAWVPMVDPSGDALSYYVNRSSSYASSTWLRWCWRCYLELPPNDKDKAVDIFSLETLEERLAHGSNRTAWTESPWRQTLALARLVDPTLDLPPGLDKESAPQLVISTNKGDVLYNDGVKLVQALQEKRAKVKHLDHAGSHYMGTYLSSKDFQELVDTWKEMLFA